MSRNTASDRESVLEEYSQLAPHYDSRWSSYVRLTTDSTVDRLPQTLGDTLDVGCGTGALLSRLAPKLTDSRLCGVDASAEMLDLARKRWPRDIELTQCWAEELPHDSCSFDTVVSCNMFHYIRQPAVAISEMLRVLRPNGTMVITDWCDDYITGKIGNLYLQWFEPSHYRMYSVSECRSLLQVTGADRISSDRYKVSWLWGLMTVLARKPAKAPPSVSVHNVT